MEKDTITASEPLHNGALEENDMKKNPLLSWQAVITFSILLVTLIHFLE